MGRLPDHGRGFRTEKESPPMPVAPSGQRAARGAWLYHPAWQLGTIEELS
jgi:hypothetical protein